jgi:hypothetical protein
MTTQPKPAPQTIAERRAAAAEVASIYTTSRQLAEAQNAKWPSLDPNAPKLDETIPGGRFTVNGRLVNAWGLLINEEGSRIHDDGSLLSQHELAAERERQA